MQFNKNKVGLAAGKLLATLHLLWIIAIGAGAAQWYLDTIFRLHMLNNPFTVLPFSWASAIELLIITFIVGYIVGWIFAYYWNWLHRK